MSEERNRGAYEYGSLRHPVEQVQLLAQSRKWNAEQREIKKLDKRWASGKEMSLRDVAKRSSPQGQITRKETNDD